jgi:hypothetical protein
MSLNKVMSCYASCNSLDQKVQCLLWAKKILSPKEKSWLFTMLLRTDKQLDRVVQHYRENL